MTTTNFVKTLVAIFIAITSPFVYSSVEYGKYINSKSIIFLLCIEFFIAALLFTLLMTMRNLHSTIADRWHRPLFYLFGIMATLLSIGLGLFGSFAVPVFESIFVSYGDTLPLVSSVVFHGRNFLWLSTVVVIFLWLSSTRSKRYTPFAVMCGLDIGVFVGVIWALYRPIYF